MSDKNQRKLVTALSIVIALVASRPITRRLAEEIPERRGIEEDLLESVLQGLVWTGSFLVASMTVREVSRRLR